MEPDLIAPLRGLEQLLNCPVSKVALGDVVRRGRAL